MFTGCPDTRLAKTLQLLYFFYSICLRVFKSSNWRSWNVHGKYSSFWWMAWSLWFSKEHPSSSTKPISLHRLVEKDAICKSHSPIHQNLILRFQIKTFRFLSNLDTYLLHLCIWMMMNTYNSTSPVIQAGWFAIVLPWLPQQLYVRWWTFVLSFFCFLWDETINSRCQTLVS